MKKLLMLGLVVAIAASPCESYAQKTMLKRVGLGAMGAVQGFVAALCLAGDVCVIVKVLGDNPQQSVGEGTPDQLKSENARSAVVYLIGLTALSVYSSYRAYQNLKEAFSSDAAEQSTISKPVVEEKSLAQVVVDEKRATSEQINEVAAERQVS